jgi:hypothetical protein
MPLNKLENFIKNTEGRILYVNPNDLDATDSITNEGNSLTKPFKTIQRALLESARFTYRRGINNDKNDQTTILVFPGEHVIDNRPGWGIVNQSGAKAWRPSDGNASQSASDVFDLNLESNFDLTQEDNILYKFNSVYGGTIIPRGTSLVGLDLRKTKIRPKYVPNPTDSAAKRTAIFRLTGNCYFWQFSIFDADESGVVYTNPIDFTDTAKPTFSHHKLTCFEYADGVNIPKNISSLFAITDLDMYYAKLSNAYNTGSDNKNIDQKWPSEPLGFAKERPEWEIVGAFATDPLTISSIYSGDGSTSSSIVTVQTTNDHNLTVDTPIKINGVGFVGQLTANYNVSTKVQSVQSANTFTYVIPYIDPLTPANPTFSGATVTVETDTVKGGSPYIFNISLRSVWGMNGMLADGSKASGFRSMVVAQFTGVSLQKDDRAFVKYNVSSRNYDAIDISKVTGPELSTQSSSINVNKVYHLDSGAIYRSGWESSHIKAINDSFIQIVSVFAIGFNKHFDSESGGDLSITNSNSNFGQISLAADGFKVDAFDKDDHAYVTSIITPRAIVSSERNIDWFAIDVGVTTQVGISSHLYIFGFDGVDQVPPIITQGYRVGARTNDKLYVNFGAIAGYGVSEASIYMLDNVIETGIKTALGITSAVKELSITTAPTTSNTFTFATSGNHNLNTGEKVKIVSEVGDIPEGLIDHQTYYIIKISANQFQLASSLTNAKNGSYIRCYLGEQLLVRSRVSEKYPGEVGSPVQFDTEKNKWFVHVNANNQIYNTLSSLGVSGIGAVNTQTSFIKRIEDTRSLDEKIYKVRVVIPKEAVNAKNPEDAFIIQESNATNISPSPLNSEFNLDVITSTDYDWDRNPRFISGISTSGSIVTVISELPHNLKQGNIVKITNVVSSDNASATDNIGYNGSFMITEIVDDKTFKHSTTDIFELSHLGTFGTFQNNTANRTTSLPRFQRVDLKTNYYVYRNEVISQYIQDVQDGIYHLYLLKADRQVTEEFTNLKHSQNVVNLYPELDRDNVNDSPASAYSYSKRSPIGDVVTNDLKRSLTKEAVDTFVDDFGFGMQINAVTRDNVSGIATLTFARPHNLSGIVSCTISNAGTTYTGVGTYHNVKIFSDSSLAIWNGATARVTVSSGATISGVSVITGGSGYSAGTYYLDDVLLGKGAGTQATISVASNQLSSQVGNVVQVTGIGSISDSYYRITGVGATNKIAIALTSGDPLIASGQYAFQIGPSISIDSSLSSYNSTTGISTITCTSAHGLVSGNKFRIVSIGNTNLGDYVVSERVGVNTFTTKTNANLPLISGRILKHGFSANDAISDSSGENLGTRSVTFFDNEIATLEESIVGVSTFIISTSGISTSSRFSIGDYIQIDDEIMRVSKSSLTGSNGLSVIRGYFGSNKSNHDKGSLIRKIKAVPIEFRRPSVIRASGHTFEYLGFGPGNYSTGLPQIQDRTLTEREDFLGQSQERSCGSVVYTGMNNRGDFYIGNKRVTSATGEEKTFDAPVPTVTGEDPSRLSAVFDEVTIKERLKVEGGKSKTILSQFDGPVTFTNNVKVTNADLEIIDGRLLVSDTTQSISKDTGALIVEGGVGIEKNVYVGGTLNCSDVQFGNIRLAQIDDNTINTSSGNLSLGAIAGSRVAITTNTTITGILSVTDDITAFWTSDQRLKDNITPIDDPLTKVLSISGNTFNWNEKSNKSGHDVGVIAQEVLEVLPEAVTTRDNGYLAVDYHKVVPLLVEAIKELSAKVENLEQKLSDK